MRWHYFFRMGELCAHVVFPRPLDYFRLLGVVGVAANRTATSSATNRATNRTGTSPAENNQCSTSNKSITSSWSIETHCRYNEWLSYVYRTMGFGLGQSLSLLWITAVFVITKWLSYLFLSIYLSATTVVLPVGVRYTVSILTEVSTATGDRAPSVPLNRTTILTGTGLLTANASALYLKGALENPLLLLWILLFKRS